MTGGQAGLSSVDPDQMMQKAESDRGLHCLPLSQQILDTSASSKTDFFFFQILGQVCPSISGK